MKTFKQGNRGIDAIQQQSYIVGSLCNQVRFYNPQVLSDTITSRFKDRAKQLQLSERKSKTFKPALDHFRLTRFGWEHRKAGSEGEKRRGKSNRESKLAGRIAFVSPRDYKTMRIYFPHVNIKIRQTPIDTNFNLREARRILPAHIG